MENAVVTLTREKINECRGHWGLVQERAGVSKSWISQFASGQITNPTINTLHAVSNACDEVLMTKKAAA